MFSRFLIFIICLSPLLIVAEEVSFDRDIRPDHLWHWTFYIGPENKPFTYNGVGAVLRLRLSDYDLSVHTSGLRNPCGISFDPNWCMFTNDNDQEGAIASPCKLVYTPAHSCRAG